MTSPSGAAVRRVKKKGALGLITTSLHITDRFLITPTIIMSNTAIAVITIIITLIVTEKIDYLFYFSDLLQNFPSLVCFVWVCMWRVDFLRWFFA